MIRTMIVDDEALIHVTLRSMIDWENRGYTVVCDCNNGTQAMEYLRDFPVDLLITDIKMPGMSGLELMRNLRASSYMPVTVALSGYDEFDLVREAFRLGAYDYLLKANINRISLERLLDGLQEKVFRQAGAGNGADRRPPDAPVKDYADTWDTGCFDGSLYGILSFTVQNNLPSA